MSLQTCNLIFSVGLMTGFVSFHFILESNFLPEGQLHRYVGRESVQQKPLQVHAHAGNSSHNNTTRILCWVMTGPKNLESRTRHIRETWANRCDKVLYMSSVETDFPTVGLNVSEGRDNLYWKTIRAFEYIYRFHLDDADWFLKADDDTFVVVENLRYTLSKYDTEKPLYLGRRFRPFVSQGYMSGGAGYVLSKEALRRFIKGFQTGECTHTSSIEDMELGKCMQAMKVEVADSRDVKGRETFHAFPPNHYLIRTFKRPRPWYLIYDYYTPVEVCTKHNTLTVVWNLKLVPKEVHY
ncbi:uncharacterized protein V6R79_023868 [Siganus canaliculatus]